MVGVEISKEAALAAESSSIQRHYFWGTDQPEHALADTIAYIEAEIVYYDEQLRSASSDQQPALIAHITKLGSLLGSVGLGNVTPAQEALLAYGESLGSHGLSLLDFGPRVVNERDVQTWADQALTKSLAFINLAHSLR